MEMTTWRCLLHQANRQISCKILGEFQTYSALPHLQEEFLENFERPKKATISVLGNFFGAPAKHHQRHSPGNRKVKMYIMIIVRYNLGVSPTH